MEAYWKTAAVLILTVILSTAMGKSDRGFSTVLSVTACCIVLMPAVRYLNEVIAFLWNLGASSGYDDSFLETLLQIAGIALTTEITGLISSDAGNSSLGKAMQILGNAAILFLALPLFQTFFTMIQEIMGMV